MSRQTRITLLGCAIAILAVLGIFSFEAWRTRKIKSEFDKRGIKIEPIGDGALFLQANSPVGMTADDIRQIRHFGGIAVADLSKSDVSGAVINALIDDDNRFLTLKLRNISLEPDAFELQSSNQLWMHVDLSDSEISDAPLERLHQMGQYLEYLSLARSSLGDKILANSSNPESTLLERTYNSGPGILNLEGTHLSKNALRSIRWSPYGLNLKDTGITDAAFDDVSSEILVYLDLTNTPLTDEVLPKLKSFKRLRVIRLDGTSITDEGISKFNSDFPQVSIIDRLPKSSTARSRLVDAMCHGELIGRVSDQIWNDLRNVDSIDRHNNSIAIGVADNVEEGHVVLYVLMSPEARFVLHAGFSIPVW